MNEQVSTDDLLLDIARILTSLLMGYKREMYEPELKSLHDALGEKFYVKTMGGNLMGFAFDGDRANAVRRFIKELVGEATEREKGPSHE